MDPSSHIISCPNCRTELEVLSGMAESQAKCSACMTRFGLDAQLQPVPGDPAEPGGSMQMVRLLYPPSNEPPPTMTSQAERLPDAPRPRLKVMETIEEPPPAKVIARRRERLFWAIVGSLLLLIVLAVLGWQLWRRYGSTGAAGSAAPPPTIPMTALSPPAPVPAIRPATGSGGRRPPATRSSGTGARP